MNERDELPKPGPVLLLGCRITRSNPTIAAQSNEFDRMTIVSNAVTLLLVKAVAGVAWTAFWSSFLPVTWSVWPGLLCAMLIFKFDQAVGASDWEMAGVLRTEPAGWRIWAKLALRVALALVLAQFTAIGATLWMFGQTIENHLQAKRNAANEPVKTEYAERKRVLEERLLAPLQYELEQSAEARALAAEEAKGARLVRDEAAERAGKARIEAGREADGFTGYTKGEGPRYREALRQQEEANRLLARGEGDLAASQGRVTEMERKVELLTAQLQERTADFRRQSQELDAEMERDPRWVPVRNDPLIRFMAIRELQKDPTYGPAVTEFFWLMSLVLVGFELMFVLVKMVFAPASVYTVRMIARARAEAARVSAEHAAKVHEIRRNRPRGNLRVVGGLDAEQGNDNGGEHP